MVREETEWGSRALRVGKRTSLDARPLMLGKNAKPLRLGRKGKGKLRRQTG